MDRLAEEIVEDRNKVNKKIKKQAGAEQCQAQHQLWEMLLEELDISQLGCLSLDKY